MTLLAQMELTLNRLKYELVNPENSDIQGHINGRISELKYWIDQIRTNENIQIS